MDQRSPTQKKAFDQLQTLGVELTFTQWEYWLALVHKVNCLVLLDKRCFPGGLDGQPLLDASQQNHVQTMRFEIGQDLTGEFQSNSDICLSIWQYVFMAMMPEATSATGETSSNDLGQIVGFANDVETIETLLELNDVLVIYGTGGSGKTTLAKEVQRKYDGAKKRVLWVDLLRCSDTNNIRGEIVRTVFGHRASALPDSFTEASLSEQVALAIAQDQPQLIILDNAEHVTQSVGEIATELKALRADHPHKVLITSQDTLQSAIPDCPAIPVDPLTYPDRANPEQWNLAYTRQCESATLFVRRTKGRITTIDDTNWETIATICFMLRGIPLTLELAGGFLAAHHEMTLDDLLERVQEHGAFFDETEENLPSGTEAKIRSARASVEWTLSLCSQANRDRLTRLAYLPDGFTTEIALCIDSIEDEEYQHSPQSAENNHGDHDSQPAPAIAADRTVPTARDDFNEIIRTLCASSILQPKSRGRYHIVEAIRQHLLRGADAEDNRSLMPTLQGMLNWLRPARLTIPCEPDAERIRKLTEERGNVLRLVELGASYPGTRAIAKALFANYIPTLERLGPAQLVIDRASLFSAREFVDSPIPDVVRVAHYAARATWSIGNWKKAEEICNSVSRQLLRFSRDATKSVVDDQHSPGAVPLQCDVDIILFLTYASRTKAMSGYDGKKHQQVAELLDLAESLLARLTASGTYSKRTIAYLHAVLTLRRSRLLDRDGGSQRSLDLVRSFLSDPRFAEAPTGVRAKMLNSKGLSEWHLGDFVEANESLETAGQLFQDANDDYWYAGTLTNRAFLMTDLENFPAAIELCEQAAILHRKVGNRAWEGTNLGAWGMALIWNDQIDEGIDRLQQGLRIVEANDPETAAQFHGDVGRALLYRDRPHELEKAIMSLEIAIETQSTATIPTRRLFGNVVLMADAQLRDNAPRQTVQEFSKRARDIAAELQLKDSSKILQVKRDLRRLKSIERALDESQSQTS